MISGDELGPLRLRNVSAPPTPIAKYYLYSASQAASFTVPIFVLFFLERDLSFAEIGLLEAVFTIIVLTFETPTGYIGDRIGRRNSMFAGAILGAIGMIGYAFSHSIFAFLAVSSLRGIAETFRSGSSEAWLYDTLKENQNQEKFVRVSGKSRSIALATGAGAAVIGSVLYEFNHLLPWIAEATVSGLGALVLLTASEPSISTQPSEDTQSSEDTTVEDTGNEDENNTEDKSGDKEKEEDGDKEENQENEDEPNPEPISVLEAASVARETLTKRSLGAFVIYIALIFGILNTVEIFVQPITVDIVGIPAKNLGFVYAGFTIVSAVASSQTDRIKRIIGIKNWFKAAPPILGLSFVTVAVFPLIALPAFFASRILAVISNPLANQYINDRTPSKGRATVLSGVSMVRSVFTAPLNTFGGLIATVLFLPHALGSIGAILVAGSFLIYLWRSPVVSAFEAPEPN